MRHSLFSTKKTDNNLDFCFEIALLSEGQKKFLKEFFAL